MKYGVIVFDKTSNIGDDIQSYAAAQLFPKVDYYIDRENLDLFQSEDHYPVKTIMNGWYNHNKLAWPISPYIDPLYISMHFYVDDPLCIGKKIFDDFGSKNLRERAPVGCRDYETLSLFEDLGIPAYFSGCVTLTLKPVFPRKKEKYVCLVDVGHNVEEYVRKEYQDLDIKVISHEDIVDCQKEWADRFKDVETLLELYQNADCVVTKRIHCALPCLALGTPVLLLNDASFDSGRMSGLEKLFNRATINEYISNQYKYNLRAPLDNPNEYIKYADQIRESVISFLQKPGLSMISEEEYINDLKERAKWKNSILLEASRESEIKRNDLLKENKKLKGSKAIQISRKLWKIRNAIKVK